MNADLHIASVRSALRGVASLASVGALLGGFAACDGDSIGQDSQDATSCEGAKKDKGGRCRLPNGRFAKAKCCAAPTTACHPQLASAIDACVVDQRENGDWNPETTTIWDLTAACADIEPMAGVRDAICEDEDASFCSMDIEAFATDVLPICRREAESRLLDATCVFGTTWGEALRSEAIVVLGERRLVVGDELGPMQAEQIIEAVRQSTHVGVLLAALAVPLLLADAPAVLPSHSLPGINLMVVAVSLGLSVGTVLLFALLPAFRAGRVAPAGVLQEEGRGASGGRRRARARSVLVALEIALSLSLLVGAGLLIESLRRVGAVDTGVDASGVLAAAITLTPPPAIVGEEGEAERLRHATHYASRIGPLTESLRALPGVRSVGFSNSLPMGGGGGSDSSVDLIGWPRPASAAEQPFAQYRFSDPGYFKTLGIPLLNGRDFNSSDMRAGEWPNSVVVNEAFVQRYLGTRDPIGQQLGNLLDEPPKTIIGVVGNTHLFGRENEVPAEVYFPLTSNYETEFQFALKVDGDPAALAETLRRTLNAFDPNMPVLWIRDLEEVITGGSELRQFNLSLMLVFSCIALALAALGIYAVIAYSVTQRRHEIGTRMSLGATAMAVVTLILGEGVRLLIFGLVLGLGGALLLGRVLSSQLYGVGATDPKVIASVAAVLALVALLACAIPALRAARIAPREALS